MQKPTKVYGRRPFGVGILVAGYDVSRLCLTLHERLVGKVTFNQS